MRLAYPLAVCAALASLGELIASDLLNLGTAGVSKAALRFTDPPFERETGVFGTTPSSLRLIQFVITK